MGRIDQRLLELGVVLPVPITPKGKYAPFVISGSYVFVSGQLCCDAEGQLPSEFVGKVGANISPEKARAAARCCAINILAQLKVAVGDLDRIKRCVRLGGFVNAAPSFDELSFVMNGASDLVVDVFGDTGLHARTTVGSQLPRSAAVEVEGIFEFA